MKQRPRNHGRSLYENPTAQRNRADTVPTLSGDELALCATIARIVSRTLTEQAAQGRTQPTLRGVS